MLRLAFAAVGLAACALGCVEEEHVVVRPVRVAYAYAPAPAVVPPPLPVRYPARRPVRVIGAGASIGPLVVFPILADVQPDLPPLVTLDAAIHSGSAVVRETGRTNEVVIENHADVEIYVLAGTVLTGGDQDREVGEDVIVGARTTVTVTVYCIERGRSSPRAGVENERRFGTLDVLVGGEVRAAAQYGRDQSRVWDRVGDVNAAHRKPRDGTLVASLHDPTSVQERTRLAAAVAELLDRTTPQNEVVGMAYAIDGRVRSVRWFATHPMFELFRRELADTAALEAVMTRPEGGAPGGVAVPPAAVSSFVSEIESAEKKDRGTSGENTNRYRESAHGYGSAVLVRTPAGGLVRYAADFMAK